MYKRFINLLKCIIIILACLLLKSSSQLKARNANSKLFESNFEYMKEVESENLTGEKIL